MGEHAIDSRTTARLKALVIDDDEEVLAFAAEVLNSFAPGFDVATARDFEEALLWLGVFRPDLLMVDPKLCGERVGAIATALRASDDRRIGDDGRVGDERRSGHHRRVCKIVALSDGAGPELLREPEGLAAHAILAKPLQLRDLLSTVRSVLDRSPALDGWERPEMASRDHL